MTVGAALLIIIVGAVVAAFLNATIGLIVAAIGVVGLVLALLSSSRVARV